MYSWENSSENGSSSGENECPQFILMSSLVLIILCTRGNIQTKHPHWHFHHQCIYDRRSVKRVKEEVERLREKKTLIIDHILNYYILIKNNRVESFSCIASLFVCLCVWQSKKESKRSTQTTTTKSKHMVSICPLTLTAETCGHDMWGGQQRGFAMALRAHGCKLTL